MTFPLRSATPSKPHSRSPVVGDGEPVAWGRAAATAVAVGRDAQGALVCVQALCWPIVPNAWVLLQQAWAAVCANRQSVGKDPLAWTAPPTSWIGERAPQLVAPFRDTPAEESSVAGLLARTPIQIGLGISTIGSDPAAAQRQTLAECLGVYGEHLRQPGRSPCTTVVTRGGDADGDRQSVDALLRARLRMADSAWLQDLRMQFAREDAAPLPLEAAAVVARSVVERLAGRPGIQAVLDVAVAKFVRVPDFLKRPVKSGKRR